MSGAPLCLWCNPAWCRYVVQNRGRCEAGRDAVTAVEYHHSTSQQGTPAGWGSLHLHQRRVCTSTSSVGELSPEPPDLLLILVPLWISAVATEANAPSPPYLHWRKFSKWLRKVTERGRPDGWGVQLGKRKESFAQQWGKLQPAGWGGEGGGRRLDAKNLLYRKNYQSCYILFC